MRDEYGVSIATPILLLRFPDGDVEYRSALPEFSVGTRLRAGGTTWRVREFDGQSVVLEALDGEAPDGAAPGPIVFPDPLGDKPLTLEVLAEV